MTATYQSSCARPSKSSTTNRSVLPLPPASPAVASSASSRSVSVQSSDLYASVLTGGRHVTYYPWHSMQLEDHATIASDADQAWRAGLRIASLMVQGPPGTGKTHTIVAIASAVLFGKASSGADAARAAPSVTMAAKNASGRRGEGPPPAPHCRLLVCAQSNAAVDELVSRLAQQVGQLPAVTRRYTRGVRLCGLGVGLLLRPETDSKSRMRTACCTPSGKFAAWSPLSTIACARGRHMARHDATGSARRWSGGSSAAGGAPGPAGRCARVRAVAALGQPVQPKGQRRRHAGIREGCALGACRSLRALQSDEP